MPQHHDPTPDLADAPVQYTQDDLDILHEIIALASSAPGRPAFRTIWRAYDTVLPARHIDPALDKKFFRFILEMESAPGEGLREKFEHMLERLGIDQDNTEFREPSEEITEAFNRSRYEDVREARGKVRHEFSEEEYHAEDESQSKIPRRLRQLEVRATARRSANEEAVKAANAAAGARMEEFKQRRSGSSGRESEAEEDGPKPVVPEDAADGLYELRQRMMVRQYLRDWHAATIHRMVEQKHREQKAVVYARLKLMKQAFNTWQENVWYSKVDRYAEDFYNQKLAMKAWSVWVQQTATILQRTEEVRQKIIARKYFNAWREVVQQNERMVRQFQLERIWDRWLDNHRKRKELEQRAVGYYNGYLAVRVYWTWYFKLCGTLATYRYDEKLIKISLDSWIQRTETQVRLGRMADAFFRRKTLQTVFAHWAKRTEAHLERQDLACDYAEWRLMLAKFDTWKRATIMAPRTRALQEYSYDRVASEFLRLWRERAKHSVAAAELSRLSCLRYAVKQWRLVLRQRIIQENHDTLLKERALQNWACQERYQLLRRTNDRRLARKVIQDFTTNLRLKSSRFQTANQDALILRDRNLARSALSCWIYKLDRIATMERHSELHFETTTASHVLTIWRNKMSTYTAYSSWASDSIWYFTAKHAFSQLKTAYTAARKSRLKQTHHTLVRQRKRALAARTIEIWRSRLADVHALHHSAETFDSERHEDLAQTIVQHWRDSTLQITADIERAENSSAYRLMRWGMTALLARHQTTVLMNQEADLRFQRTNQNLIAAYIRRWDTRFWELTLLYDRGERLFARKEALRVKSILRAWRDMVKTKPENEEQFEGFPEVLMPPPMTALRRRMEMSSTPATPGFKTARRRGLLGNAMSQTPLGSPGSPLKRFAVLGLGASRLGRVSEPVDEDEEGSHGSATATFVGSRASMDKW